MATRKKFTPENRNNRDYFDTPSINNLLALQSSEIVVMENTKTTRSDLHHPQNPHCFNKGEVDGLVL
jgi:hypothetical protein